MSELKEGNINISITEADISYESGFSIPEVLFWLDVVKFKILTTINGEEANGE